MNRALIRRPLEALPAFAGLALWLSALLVSGCSLLLDPEVCSNNSDCNGGVCTRGVCVGGNLTQTDLGEQEDAEPDAELDMAVVEPDLDLPPDAADAAPPVPDEGAPVPLAPTCEFAAPRDALRLTTSSDVAVIVVVGDRDTPIADLVVTLNGEPVTPGADGIYEEQRELAEGANPFVLRAEDPGGLFCTAEITVTRDSTPPQIQFIQPGSSAETTNRTPYPVIGRMTDAHPKRSGLVVKVDGAVVRDLAVTWTADRFEFDLPLEEGDNPVTIEAEDQVGNASAPVALNLLLDTIPPEVVVDAPADNITTGASRITVRGHVEVGMEGFVSQVALNVTAGARRAGPFGGGAINGVFSHEVQLFAGRNDIEVCGDDEAGNVGCTTVRVLREDDQPCVEITAPRVEFHGEQTVRVTGTMCPVVATVELSVNEGDALAAVLDRGAGTYALDVPLTDPGATVIRALATTAEGATATDLTEFFYDPTPPSVAITRPIAGICARATAESQLEVCANVADLESGLERVLVLVGQQSSDMVRRAGTAWCANVVSVEAASVLIRVRALNRAGLTRDASVTIDIDQQAPRLVAASLAPPREAWVRPNANGKVLLSGRVDGGVCPPIQMQVIGGLVGGGNRPIQLDGPNNAFSFSSPAGNLRYEDGPQSLRIRIVDSAGNGAAGESDEFYAFRVDGTPPELREIVPAGALHVTSLDEVSVSTLVCDVNGSGVHQVTIGGGAPVNGVAAGAGCQRFTKTIAVAEGLTPVAITAVDAVGNSSRHDFEISYDVTGPEVQVEYPADGDLVPSRAIVSGVADDGEFGSGVNRVEVNGVRANYDEATGRWLASGVVLSPGENTLTVIGYDNEDNETDPPITISVTVSAFAEVPAEVLGLTLGRDIGWVGQIDANGDGRLDILALPRTPEGEGGLFLRRADGTYLARSLAEVGLPTDGVVVAAAVGDFNADGIHDVFIAGVGAPLNDVWLGNGMGGFFKAPNSGVPAAVASQGLAVGDINRDGQLDVILLAGLSTQVLIAEAGGARFVPQPLAGMQLTGLGDHRRATLVDLNRDGVLDLVATGAAGTSHWSGTRVGIFNTVAPANAVANAAAEWVLPVDANRDGAFDVLTAAPESARFSVSAGAGYASDPLGFAVAAHEIGTIAADLTGNGREDLISFGTEGMRVWVQQPVGGFLALPNAGLPAIGPVQALAAVDVDEDGDFDLIVGQDEGVRILHSNANVMVQPYRFAHLMIRRGREQSPGPIDAIGVQVLQNLTENGPDRALLASTVGPTLVTMGGALLGDFIVRFVDRGTEGGNTVSLDSVETGDRHTVNAPE